MLWKEGSDHVQLAHEVCLKATAANSGFEGECISTFHNVLQGISVRVMLRLLTLKSCTLGDSNLSLVAVLITQFLLKGFRSHERPLRIFYAPLYFRRESNALQMGDSSLLNLLDHYGTQISSVHQDTGVVTHDIQPNPTWSLDRLDQAFLPLDDQFYFYNLGSGINVYVIDTVSLSPYILASKEATVDCSGSSHFKQRARDFHLLLSILLLFGDCRVTRLAVAGYHGQPCGVSIPKWPAGNSRQ